VSLVNLDSDGALHPASETVTGHVAKGAKITFTDADGKAQVLYYFSSDISNDGAKSSGLLKFCSGLGHADAFVKSASYLMHSDNFSTIRDFLLEHSDAIVQDDSGIPARNFKPDGSFCLGNYVQPLSIFPRTYQPMLAQLYRRTVPACRFRDRLSLRRGSRTSCSPSRPRRTARPTTDAPRLVQCDRCQLSVIS
jgi:hypothetical protein